MPHLEPPPDTRGRQPAHIGADVIHGNQAGLLHLVASIGRDRDVLEQLQEGRTLGDLLLECGIESGQARSPLAQFEILLVQRGDAPLGAGVGNLSIVLVIVRRNRSAEMSLFTRVLRPTVQGLHGNLLATWPVSSTTGQL